MRQIWTGSISFGLIHIPINLYSATKESRIDFDYLRKKDHCPIRFARICKDTGEEVPYDQIVRGYEYEKGEYVILTDEDFKAASVEKTQTVEIVQFIQATEVDPMLLEKPYYLEPSKWAEKVYVLLRDALVKSNRVGLARFVLKTREYMGIVQPKEDMLILVQMRYQEEIRDASELRIPEKSAFSKKELDIAVQFIDELTATFQSKDWHDTYNAELMKLIDKKRKGKKIIKVHTEEREFKHAPDLMAQLRQSLEMAKKDKNK